MFGGERAQGLAFAEWPPSPPGDPRRDFVTLRA
jgi:hypothetical protein